jgi:hypothetical protein
MAVRLTKKAFRACPGRVVAGSFGIPKSKKAALKLTNTKAYVKKIRQMRYP